MIKSDSIQTLLRALFAAQQEFPAVVKEANNPFFKSKYADLVSCLETVTPTLVKHGLMVLQFPTSDGPGVGVLTFIAHPGSGEYLAESYAPPLEKLGAQQGAAAVTYARRIALLAALGIAAEDDDDGETAAGRGKFAKKNSTKSAKTPAPAGPPKAEFPSEEPASAGSSGAPLPTAEYLAQYKGRLRKIAEEVKGIEPPINKRLIRYVYQVTGAQDLENIPAVKWEAFFKIVDNIQARENGSAILAALINDVKG